LGKLTLLIYPISLIMGLPLLLLLVFKNYLVFQKALSYHLIYTITMIFMLIVTMIYFHLKANELGALFFSFTPGYFYLLRHHNLKQL
jgi:hypothetical protein